MSLHAIASIRTEDMMQLRLSVSNQESVVLLDSGKTHNFVSSTVARCTGQQFHSSEGAHVVVANGDRVACHGLARDVSIHINNKDFTVD